MSQPMPKLPVSCEAARPNDPPFPLPTRTREDELLLKKLKTPWAPEGGVPATQIHLDVSSRCDQKCSLCYYPIGAAAEEVTRERALEIARKHRGCSFILGGREPTMRPDLDDIIRAIRPFGSVLLLTHGLNLSRRGYLQSLLEAGLDGVILSFNGVSDDTYRALNGKPCLAGKWLAFETLKRLRVPTIISMTVSPGVNDDQIGAVLRLCQESTDFVKELRLRVARPLGRFPHPVDTEWHMPDLLRAVSFHAGLREDVVKQGIDFWHTAGEALRIDAYRPQLCTVTFMMKQEAGRWKAEGELIAEMAKRALEGWNQRKWARPLYLFFLLLQMVRFYGVRPVLRRLLDIRSWFHRSGPPSHRKKIRAVAGCPNLLQITLKAWPHPKRFLSTEQRKCGTLYVSQHRCEGFCARNITR
jgi:pyruvate-formate lyase-activating enzyme